MYNGQLATATISKCFHQFSIPMTCGFRYDVCNAIKDNARRKARPFFLCKIIRFIRETLQNFTAFLNDDIGQESCLKSVLIVSKLLYQFYFFTSSSCLISGF